MKRIDISHLPKPIEWFVFLFIITILIFVMTEFSEEVKETVGDECVLCKKL
jgi:hypothetical protein